MHLMNELLKKLKEVRGSDLDFENHHYFLFFEDGVFDVYLDKDEEELKVNIQLSDGVNVYHTQGNLRDLLNRSVD